MPIDTKDPQSAGWWFARLLKKLSDAQPRYAKLDRYLRGENVLPVHADKTLKDAAQRLLVMSNTNVAQVAVRAPLNRMKLIGCRTAAPGDQIADSVGAELFAANSLTATATMVQRTSLALSMGYVIVGGPDPDIGNFPLITAEDPREVYVEVDPAKPWKPLAAIKVYLDDVTATWRAVVFLPGGVHRFEKRADTSDLTAKRAGETPHPTPPSDIGGWVVDGPSEAIPGNLVPVTPFPCQPDSYGRTEGVYEPHLGLIDRIGFTVMQRLEVATMQAFKQRALKGGPRTDPQTGDPIDYNDVFEPGPGAIWHLPEGAELWESGQVDLGPIRLAVRDDIQDFAALTGIPLFYLTPDASDGSAEGAALAREQLIFLTRDLIDDAKRSWRRVLSNAFTFMGDDVRANPASIDAIFLPPERRSLSEMADGATKALAGGRSVRGTLRDVWGLDPKEIEAEETELYAEALRLRGIEAAAELVTGGTGTGSQPPAG